MKNLFSKVAAFSALLISIFVSACSDAGNAPSPHQVSEKKTIEELAAETALPIPRASTIVEYKASDDSIDPTWVAKISIPGEDSENLKASLREKPADEGTVHNGLAERTVWWNPQNVLFSKQYMTSHYALVRTTLSQDDGRLFLYVEHAVIEMENMDRKAVWNMRYKKILTV